MPLKKLNPITPGTRNAVHASFEEITAKKPEKSLLEAKQNHAGRNNRGRITSRSRGGGSRRMYRKIDFKRIKDGVPGRVKSIEYDPNHMEAYLNRSMMHALAGRSEAAQNDVEKAVTLGADRPSLESQVSELLSQAE